MSIGDPVSSEGQETALNEAVVASGFPGRIRRVALAGLNLGFRLLTMLSKFLLVLIITRYMGAEENGRYTLVLATIVTVMTAISMRFDLFATRELCSHEPERHREIIRNQFAFHGLMYATVGPLTLGLFAFGLLPWTLLLPFYGILLLEHASNEVSRLLVPLRRPIHANFILFLRSGLWVFVLWAMLHFMPGARTLDTVWLLWALGAGISILLGGSWVLRLTPAVRMPKVDWNWIKLGFRASLTFSLGAFFIASLLTVDRYFLEHHTSLKTVGAYGFYVYIANLIQTIAETGVALILLPTILSTYAKRDMPAFHSAMRKFARNVTLTTFASVGVALLGTYVALRLLNEPEYSRHMDAFAVMMVMGVFNAIGLIPQYGLYARGQERLIMIGNAVGLGVALALHIALVPSMGILGSAIATCTGMIALFFTKLGFYMRLPSEPEKQPDVTPAS